MRIVTKINAALGALIGLSIILNFGALEFTVKPGFASLEEKTARDNHARVLEAIKRLEDQVESSAHDYAAWDDTYEFMHGRLPDYLATNISADSLSSLSVNFFAVVENSGKLIDSQGFLFTSDKSAEAELFDKDQPSLGKALMQRMAVGESGAGLMATDHGLAAVGFAKVLKSDRTGESPGILVLGALLDVAALRSTTKVDFRIDAPRPTEAKADQIIGADVIRTASDLVGVENTPIATLESTTPRAISRLGQHTIWAALALIVVAGIALLGALAVLLRRIAITRIERMRSHLTEVAASGSLSPMPDDAGDDELSEVARSFNSMAAQLAELRERIREQDYKEGAADHAAGILHNIRNGITPIGMAAWDLVNSENASWKASARQALAEVQSDAADPERVRKLQAFITLSVERFLAEGDHRKRELERMREMIRQLEEVLAEQDSASQIERVREPVEVSAAIRIAAQIVAKSRVKIEFSVPEEIPAVLASNVGLKQVFGNIFINAMEAIEATGRDSGHVWIEARHTLHNGRPALDISVRDDGDGIDPNVLGRIFDKGFSMRGKQSGGIGLHWCANAMNAMGGRIHAESAGAGRGTTLHLVLPCAVPAVAVAA